MNLRPVIEEIDQTLRTQYPAGFGAVFVGGAKHGALTVEHFKKAIGLELPEIFYQYHKWLMTTDFDDADVSEQTELGYDEANYAMSLQAILRTTEEWQRLQADDPSREWKSGFVEIASWNSCYVMVIDTEGEIGEQGNVLYWDFKGGSTYYIIYQNFEMLLRTKLELLKENLYFPPASDDAREDFYDGETRRKIEEIERRLNASAIKEVEFF